MQSEFPVEEKYMRRAFELAALGQGFASPNPVVGCVIICRDRIIGEGFHHRCGQPHAEVNAIQSVREPNAAASHLMRQTGLDVEQLLRESTLYVTLEPCSHYGKTPPCADLIVRTGIPRVVVSCSDPNPKVNGQGVALLRKAGVQVREHFLEDQGRELGRRFFTNVEKGRPYVILKWAQTVDGYITCRKGERYAVTGPALQILNHSYRTREDAIMVGTDTLLTDNPRLNARMFGGHQPLRIGLDLHGRILDCLRQDSVSPRSAPVSDNSVFCRGKAGTDGGKDSEMDFSARVPLHFFDGTQPSILFIGESLLPGYAPLAGKLKIVPVQTDLPPERSLPYILDVLWQEKIGSLIVEGGTALLESFIGQGLWDEARIFTSSKALGNGYAAPRLRGSVRNVYQAEYGGEWVHVYRP